MKHTFIIFCFILLSFSSIERARATAVIAATFPLQILQLVEEAATYISTAASYVQEKAVAIDAVIGEPVATMMINLAQQQVANDIISWANGGFEGEPLIVTDPEKYFKERGQIAVKNTLDNIAEDSVYGESVFSSLVKLSREKNLEARIEAAVKSEVPTYIQNQLCSDERLTLIATEDVKNTKTNYTGFDILKRKQEIYDFACKGNPQQDPVLAKNLLAIEKQIPDIGGLDILLYRGVAQDNPYDRAQRVAAIAKEEEETKRKIAENEVYQGSGPISQTKCVKYESFAELGKEKRCLEWATLSPGESVSSALERAANSGIDRLTNLQGEGFTSLLVNLAMAKLTKGLNTAFTSDNDSVEVVGGVKQDLKDNDDVKESILSPMMKQMTEYSSSLSRIEAIDREYLAAVLAYEARITTGRDCYNSLVASDPLKSTDPQVMSAYDFYNERQAKIDAIKDVLVPEIKILKEAKAFTEETSSKLKASNATQDISTIFNKYMITIESGKYPSLEVEAKRKGEFMKHQSDIKNEDGDQGTHETDNYLRTCQMLGGSGGGQGSGNI